MKTLACVQEPPNDDSAESDISSNSDPKPKSSRYTFVQEQRGRFPILVQTDDLDEESVEVENTLTSPISRTEVFGKSIQTLVDVNLRESTTSPPDNSTSNNCELPSPTDHVNPTCDSLEESST